MMHAKKTTISHLKEEELSIFTKLEEEMVLKREYYKVQKEVLQTIGTHQIF